MTDSKTPDSETPDPTAPAIWFNQVFQRLKQSREKALGGFVDNLPKFPGSVTPQVEGFTGPDSARQRQQWEERQRARERAWERARERMRRNLAALDDEVQQWQDVWERARADALMLGVPEPVPEPFYSVELFCGRCMIVQRGKRHPSKKPIGRVNLTPRLVENLGTVWDMTGSHYERDYGPVCPQCHFQAHVVSDGDRLAEFFLLPVGKQRKKRQSLDYLVKVGLAIEINSGSTHPSS